jgi:hypothetical protein
VAAAPAIRTILAGAPAAVAALLAGLPVALLGFANGGYFPETWGWPALALLLVAGVAVAAGRGVVSGVPDGIFLGGLVALLAWTLASALWSESGWRAGVEAQRTVVLVAAAAALLAVTRRGTVGGVAWGVFLGSGAPVVYGLATRLFPERLGVFDPIAGYRLAEPLGYWNGLGLLAAMAIVLGLGLSVAAPGHWTAGLALLPVPALAATLYFTFSRGAWIALAVGLAASLAFARAPLRLALTGLTAATAAAAAVALAARSDALTHTETVLAAAADEGRRLALGVAALCALSAVAGGAAGALAARLDAPRRVRLAAGGVLGALAVAVAVAGLVRLGGPIDAAERGWRAFSAPPPTGVVDLNDRLRSLSGNGRVQVWRVALDEWRASPVAGAGAGVFERAWLRDPRGTFKVRDAHSLYVETLAELGVVGLALVVVALAAPLAAAVRMRRAPLTAPLAGAYVAYLVHAGVDWDWELVALGLAALALGAALLAAGRPAPRRPGTVVRPAALAAVALACGLVVVSLAGNRALARSAEARADGDTFVAADAARRAAAYLPWSPQPLTALGEAQLAAGLDAVARRTFRDAIARDPGEWRPWYGLGLASAGEERSAAFATVRRLNRSVTLPPDVAATP